MSDKRKGMWNWKLSAILLILGIVILNLSSTSTYGQPPVMTTFKVEPETSSGQVGAFITVDFNVSDAEDLWGWQVEMEWDPTVLDYVSHTFGNFLAGQPGGTSQLLDPYFVDDGLLLCSEATLGSIPGVDGDGWLCSVEFEVLRLGATTIDISSSHLWTYWIDSNLDYWGDDPDEMIKEDGYFFHFDFNDDGRIDIFDVAMVARDYGGIPIQTNNPSSNTGGWTTGANAYSSDDVYAGVPKNAIHDYGNYGFSTGGWSGVAKVEVGVEGYSEGAEIIRISVSNNGGTFGITHDVVLAASDTLTWVDVTSDWGWTPDMLSDANLIVKAQGIAAGGYKNTFVDWLPVRVSPEPQAYSPYTDLNGDGAIDIFDLSMIAVRYGDYV